MSDVKVSAQTPPSATTYGPATIHGSARVIQGDVIEGDVYVYQGGAFEHERRQEWEQRQRRKEEQSRRDEEEGQLRGLPPPLR